MKSLESVRDAKLPTICAAFFFPLAPRSRRPRSMTGMTYEGITVKSSKKSLHIPGRVTSDRYSAQMTSSEATRAHWSFLLGL